jgi:hypothetical protein
MQKLPQSIRKEIKTTGVRTGRVRRKHTSHARFEISLEPVKEKA